MNIEHWWDNRAVRRDRVHALRMVGLSPKLAPLPWEKLTETARHWLTRLLVVGEIGDIEAEPGSLPTPGPEQGSTRFPQPASPPRPAPLPTSFPPVRAWWDKRATENDQVAVLVRIGLDPGYASVPWAFLPTRIRDLLARRVRVRDLGLGAGE